MDKLYKAILELRTLTPAQLCAVLTIVVSCVTAVWQVDARYAKVKAIEDRFAQNQQMIDHAYHYSLELLWKQPDADRKVIMEKVAEVVKNKDTRLKVK